MRIGRLGSLYNAIVGQDIRLASFNRYIVLEMNRWLVIRCAHRPTVTLGINLASSKVDHRLDSQHETLFQFGAGTPASVIWDLRLFMHVFAQPMPYQLTDYAITILLRRVLFDGIGDIPDPVAGDSLFNAFVKGLFRYLYQLHDLGPRIADGESICMISIPAFFEDPDIYGNDVPFLQRLIIGKTMHDHIVHRSTRGKRITAIIEERWHRVMITDVVPDQLVQLPGRYARL